MSPGRSARAARISLWIVGLSLAAAGCGRGPAVPQPTLQTPAAIALAPGDRLRVLATTSIVADAVAAVGGSRIDLASLVPPGVDPHTFEPTPQDVRRVAEAQVIFENGLGLETFLGDLVKSAGSGAPVISVSTRIDALPAGAHPGDEAGSAHAEWDPHVWLDPQNVISWTQVIEESLSALDPEGASAYAQGAQAYRRQLMALDSEVEARLSAIPVGQRQLVTDHDELAYFARRYGFEIVGAVIPAPSAAAEPSARELAALETAIQSIGVRAVFVSSVVSPALAGQVADDTGIRLVTLYVHSLTEASGPAPSYLELMRLDARVIAEALGG